MQRTMRDTQALGRLRSALTLSVLASSLILAAAGVARAEGDDACSSECSQARQVCRGAAHAAGRACADDCGDAVTEAADHARAACRAGDLSTGD